MTERTGVRSALRQFLSSEAFGGLVLMAAAALAMIVANSHYSKTITIFCMKFHSDSCRSQIVR